MHGYTFNSRLTIILNTIGIEIVPYTVSYGYRLINTGIPGDIIFSGNKICTFCQAINDSCITVSIISALVLRTEEEAIRQEKLQVIIPRQKVVEGIIAICICGSSPFDIVFTIQQIYDYAFNAGFPVILYPVGIEIIPYPVSDRGFFNSAIG